jgi:hypothetical protein
MVRIDNKRNRTGEVHVGQTFVGRHKPTVQQKGDHAQNFARALEKALQIADSPTVVRERRRMRLPTTFETSVTFEATVVVKSPGDVGEYRAVVTEV